jgi:hypothetical protein
MFAQYAEFFIILLVLECYRLFTLVLTWNLLFKLAWAILQRLVLIAVSSNEIRKCACDYNDDQCT